MNIRTLTITAVLPVLAVMAIAACGPNKHASGAASSVAANPTVSAAAHTAEQRGLTALEQCTPNGKAMIGGVVNHSASALTYTQVAETFASKTIRQKIWTCIGQRPGPVPVGSMITALEQCYPPEFSQLSQPFMRHPILHRHDITTAAIDAAAICIGKYS